MDDAARCTARSKRSGNQCGRAKAPGASVCHMHGGKAPQVAARARRRAAELEAHAAAERMVAVAGVDADPIEHLVDSLLRTAALVAVYGAMVADLDAAAARDLEATRRDTRGELGYTEASEDSHDELRVVAKDRLLGLDRHGAAQLHPFVVEYHRLIEVRAKLAKMAIDAGVAERQVRMAEKTGAMIVEVLKLSLVELGVEVTPAVAETVGRHLRAVN